MAVKTGSSTTKRPFGKKAGKTDRFSPKQAQGTVLVTSAADRERLRPKLTDEAREFIRQSDMATGGALHLVGGRRTR